MVKEEFNHIRDDDNPDQPVLADNENDKLQEDDDLFQYISNYSDDGEMSKYSNKKIQEYNNNTQYASPF